MPIFAGLILIKVGLFGSCFFQQPLESAVFKQLTGEVFVDSQQISDVLGCILELATGQWSDPPIRSRFLFIKIFSNDPMHKLGVGSRILDPEKSCCDLDVKEVPNWFLCCPVAKESLFASCMNHDGSVLRLQHMPKTGQVIHGQGVDDCDSRIRYDLDQTQFGALRILRDKLGIESYQFAVFVGSAPVLKGRRILDPIKVCPQVAPQSLRIKRYTGFPG
jgi:hypothetical protein